VVSFLSRRPGSVRRCPHCRLPLFPSVTRRCARGRQAGGDVPGSSPHRERVGESGVDALAVIQHTGARCFGALVFGEHTCDSARGGHGCEEQTTDCGVGVRPVARKWIRGAGAVGTPSRGCSGSWHHHVGSPSSRSDLLISSVRRWNCHGKQSTAQPSPTGERIAAHPRGKWSSKAQCVLSIARGEGRFRCQQNPLHLERGWPN